MKLMVVLFTFTIVLLVNDEFIVVADESLEEVTEANDENNIEEVHVLQAVIELGIWEIGSEDSIDDICVGWNEISDLLDIHKYELFLYNLDSGIVDSAIQIYFQNEPANENTFFPCENWDYEYHFSDIPEDGLYYCTIRAYSNIEDLDGHIATICSDYTQSEEIKIENPVPLTLEIDTEEWTDNTTPQITWEGIFVDEKEPTCIQYQINDGEWIDSEWIGSSGSGTFPSDVFNSDGTYKIKIRGKGEEIDAETEEKIIYFGEESEAVVYKRDADSPIVSIKSPRTLEEFENTIKISASIKDGGSDIDNWQLEFEDNNILVFGKSLFLAEMNYQAVLF